MKPTAKSLVLDLLATVGRGSVPVRALIRAGSLFGIGSNSVRVALARLVADGPVSSDERGRYQLSPNSFSSRVRSWRSQPDRARTWTGGYIAVHLPPLQRRAAGQLRRRERALRHLGFRALRPGFEIRPDNLVGGVAALRSELEGLGLDPTALVMEVGGLANLDAAAAGSLWDTEALAAGYSASLDALEQSSRRMRGLTRDEARIESFQIGGAAIARVLLDPLLPAPIGDPQGLREVVERMRDYDRLGREAWSGWMGDDADEPSHSPAELHAWVADPQGRPMQRDTQENPR